MAEPASVSDRWISITAWCAIVLILAVAMLKSLSTEGQAPVDPPFRGVVAQIRVAVGVYHLLGPEPAEQYWPKGNHSTRNQAAIAVGAGARFGTAQALASINAITDDDAVLRRDLDLLKACYAGEVIDQPALNLAWGWIGDLAAVHALPADDTRRIAVIQSAVHTVLWFFGALILGALIFITGCILAVIAWIHWERGRLPMALRPADGNAACLQSFAVYLLAFIGFGEVLHASFDSPSLSLTWLFFPIVLALVWMPIRYYSWSWPDLRHAIGLHTGKGTWYEMRAGMLGYLCGLPIMAAGFVLTAQLSRWFPANHPMSQELLSNAGSWSGVCAMFALAAGFAPLVEEIMFRGFLLHHLRRHGNVVAVVGSSLIFAAMHPQGIAGIPVLTAIAVVFSLIRIWRGSLIASMTAHALHNGTLVVIMVLVLRG